MLIRERNFGSFWIVLCIATVLIFMIIPPASSTDFPGPDEFGYVAFETGSDFREIVLPQSEIDPESISIPIASSPGLPDQPGTDTAVVGGGGTAGALTGTAAGGGSAAKQQVRPRHSDAVGRYFERKDP